MTIYLRSFPPALIAVCLSATPAPGAEPGAVPADTAELEVLAPPGARVSIDGKDRGDQRHFTYRPFRPGQVAAYEVEVTLPGGERIKREVLLHGGWRVRLPLTPSAAARPALVLQTGHTFRVNSVAFSPDGKYVLTGSQDKTAILWDAQTGQKLRTFEGHASWVHAVAFGPGGKQVLTGSSDKTAILWDVATGRKRRVLEGHKEPVTSVAVSPDGGRVLTGSADETAALWDARTGARLATFEGHTKAVTSVAFRPDGKQVVTGSLDQSVVLWDDTGRQRVFEGDRDDVYAVAFSPDGKYVLAGTRDPDRPVVLWDARSGVIVRTFQGLTNTVTSVAFSRDGKRVLAASLDKTAALWDAHSGARLRTFEGHAGALYTAVLSPDGRHVLTGSEDQTAVLWDASTARKVRTFQGHGDRVNAVAFSPDGGLILLGSQDGTATLWARRSGELLRTLTGHTRSVQVVAFSPDGGRGGVTPPLLLTASEDGTARLWEVPTGRLWRTLAGHTEIIQGAAFSPDGKQVLTCSADKTAVLWDAQTGAKLRTFKDETVCGHAAAFSRDGKLLFTGAGKTILVWDAGSGDKVRTLEGHADHIETVAVSPDGKHVATGSYDNTAILWEVDTGRRVQVLRGHTNWVHHVAFDPDGRRLLTSSCDKTAAVWDVASGRRLRTFQHTHCASVGAVSPDGRYVLIGSVSGAAHLWDVATGDELARLVSLDRGDDWLAATPEGLFDGSEGGRQKVSYRVGDAAVPAPVDRFFLKFYRPGVLALVSRGERPLPDADILSPPPTVRIVTPARDGVVPASDVTVEVETVDQGGGVKGPWVHVNGVKVLARVDPERRGKVVTLRLTLGLVEGANRIEAWAASGDGAQKAPSAVLTLRYEKPLAKPTLHIVAVGVSKYAEPTLKLKFARADAETFADLFQRRGAGTLYARVNVTLLPDEKATGAAIRRAMRQAALDAKPQDTLLLFLAGHGFVVGERYYFIPHDYRSQPGRSRDDDVRDQGVPADVLVDFLNAGSCQKRMLILDTCASGGVVKLFKVTSRSGFDFRGAIERLNQSGGVCVLAASAATEEAKEPDALGHGVLSYALLAALGAVDRGPLQGQGVRPGAGRRVVDVLEWFGYASRHVRELTRVYCRQEQNVQTITSGDSFPVLPLTAP